MTDLSNLTTNVINVIKETDEYMEYRDSLSAIRSDPALYARVNEMREKNFEIHQSNSDSEELMDLMDALTNEYEDVITNESVGRFLEAEADICKLFQDFYYKVTEGLDFD